MRIENWELGIGNWELSPHLPYLFFPASPHLPISSSPHLPISPSPQFPLVPAESGHQLLEVFPESELGIGKRTLIEPLLLMRVGVLLIDWLELAGTKDKVGFVLPKQLQLLHSLAPDSFEPSVEEIAG